MQVRERDKISRNLIRVSCLCERFRARTRMRMSRNLVRVSCLCERQTVAEFGYSFVAGARARERERSLSRARASFSAGDLFVKNEDLVLEDIWRRGDCESGAGGNTVRGLHCDEERRCW